MNIFVTGGAGFIGSHFAERCLREGWNVSVLDDLSTGAMANISALRDHPKFRYRIGTVFNPEIVAELVDECDLVLHLAAAVGVRLIVESPVRTIETNVHGTEVVLRAAGRKRKRVILASTSEVYGKREQIPFREDDDLVLGCSTIGRWSYACSKLLDEFLGLAYWREKQVPRQTGQYGMVLPTFVRQALLSEPLTVFGRGDRTRCFGQVGGVVEALIRLARAPHIAGEVINIGNDEEISILHLAELVKAVTESESEVVHVPYHEAYGPGFEDMVRRVPSLEKLERLLEFRLETPIKHVVTMVAEEMRATSCNPAVLPTTC